MKFILLLMFLTALSLVSEGLHAAVQVRQPAPIGREVHNRNHQPKLYLSKDVRLWVLGNYRAVTGKKLSFKHKVALKLLQWKGGRFMQDGKEPTSRQRKLGKMSLYFGIGAFVLAVVPIIGILSFPSAIVAVVLGITSLKGNSNKNGIVGLALGGVFILLAFLAIVVIALAFGGFFN